MPTASDLVTDLPADFEVFGQAVDTSLADLKGGTTGQVLAKASNTNMDFTWVAQDDSNAIQNAIVDAKGDLIAASAADTPARLAVGTNGQVLTADSTAATGLAWATPSGGSTFAGCYLQRSTNQTIANATLTSVTWDTETLDTNAYHSTSTNTDRITIPSGKAGKYMVGFTLTYTGSSTGIRVGQIRKNGTSVSQTSLQSVSGAGNTVLSKTHVIDLTVGDYIDLQAYQNSGGNLDLLTNAIDIDLSAFYAYYIGA